jgi:saccharopine dehydrogenase-like NADP-dependent oxidoreductase
MARILVLGGGKQGRVVAAELAKDHTVAMADLQPTELAGVTTIQADLSDPAVLVELMSQYDLAAGALPAAIGFKAAQAAVSAKRSFVDLSFYPEDAYSLDAAAKEAGITILPDCGLAPGLSNLLAGRAHAAKHRKAIHIQVGGVAEDKTAPYGYAVSWALTDLVDEYTRPARFRRHNAVQTLPACAEQELVNIDGVGEMESFLSDGCRTLLAMDIEEITEKTLRWPGHVEAIQPLVANGNLIEEFQAKCAGRKDLVVFTVDADGEVATMVERAQDGLSAMARTTALTCAAFTRLLASGILKETGVIAPERVGADPAAYRLILEALQTHDIRMTPAFPFL